MRKVGSQAARLFLVLNATAVSGLKILSPTPGSSIDPTQPLSIVWSVDIYDPALVEIRFTNAKPNAVTSDLTLATGVASYTGSYTVPENTIQNFGAGYQLLFIGNGDATIASSTDLTLGASSNQVSTDANGQLTLITSVSTDNVPAAASVSSGGILDTASDHRVTVTTLTGTATASQASTTLSVSGTSQSGPSTASVHDSSSSSSTSSSASATSAQSTNIATRSSLFGGEAFLTAAGLLTGLIALLA